MGPDSYKMAKKHQQDVLNLTNRPRTRKQNYKDSKDKSAAAEEEEEEEEASLEIRTGRFTPDPGRHTADFFWELYHPGIIGGIGGLKGYRPKAAKPQAVWVSGWSFVFNTKTS